MNQHLTSREISQWIAGQKTPAMEEHFHACPDCAAEVERVAQPLKLFRASVCSLSEQQMGPARFVLPPERSRLLAGPLRWRIAMTAAAALVIAAIPMARRLQPVSPTPAPAAMTAVSDEALLQQVKMDISQSVPSTMEPLEKLMSGDDNGRAE